MRIIILQLILCLVSVLAVFGQEVDTEYDRFKDVTRVRSKETGLTATGKSARLFPYPVVGFSCSYKGPTLDSSAVFFMTVESESSDWRFLKANELTFLIDGKPDPGPAGRHSGGVLNGAPTVTVRETMTFLLPREQFTKITTAKTVEAQVGWLETTFDDIVILRMKSVLKACTLK